jgi:hypothetical protein
MKKNMVAYPVTFLPALLLLILSHRASWTLAVDSRGGSDSGAPVFGKTASLVVTCPCQEVRDIRWPLFGDLSSR